MEYMATPYSVDIKKTFINSICSDWKDDNSTFKEKEYEKYSIYYNSALSSATSGAYLTSNKYEDTDATISRYNDYFKTKLTWSSDNWVSSGPLYTEVSKYGPVLTPLEKLREIIRSRQTPLIVTSRAKPVRSPQEQREKVAHDTLRSFLGEHRYRSFLRSGFVSVTGDSGRVYQIFPGHAFTNVFENGKPMESLCVVLIGDYPPTDHLIMRYLLILNDEALFLEKAIKQGTPTGVHRRIGQHLNRVSAMYDGMSLTEIMGQLQAA